MKKSKLLFLTPCVAIAIIAPIITSCEPSSGLTIERIIDDIFYPHEKQDPPAGTNNIMEALQTVSSEEEMQNELIYDLFLENHLFDDEGLKFKELYEQGKIGIKANITKCSLGFKDVSGVKKLYATFLGYVSFVFLQKISEDAQANDYVMITYDMLNLEVNQYAYWGLHYVDSMSNGSVGKPKTCIGFIKVKSHGGQQEHMMQIAEINTAEFYSEIDNRLPNWHGWWK